MGRKQVAARARVTRDVEPTALPDLLVQPPRATLAFVESEEVTILPARARVVDGIHQFAVEAALAPDLRGREVVLMRDAGPYWFELRGVSVRGIVAQALPPSADPGQRLAWYAVEPSRLLAWDYGALRRE
jgi:hypothetical protein